ncbi:MAG: sulfatase-like hydrolase/transferase, partial [Verrucomicrobiota bacterium]
ADRPNILWFCTDQQRFDTIGALGNPHVSTPNLDQLVGEGTSFSNCYVQSPICTPSRASFMTGLYASRLHNTRNGNDTFPSTAPPLVSKMMADDGYDCGNIGKFHLTSSGKRTEPRLEDGYRYWKFSHAPRDDWEVGHDYADWVKAKGGDLNALRESEERVPAELHQTTWGAQRTIEFLQEERPEEQPWFLTVNIYDPHPPFIPPKAYADEFRAEDMPGPHFQPDDLQTQERLRAVDFQNEIRSPEEHGAKDKQAKYYAMIQLLDEEFGRVMEALEASGQAENTLVVFTSDHGEMLGDHGLMYKGCRFYEGLVKVPLIVRMPGKISGGQVVDGLVEMLDVSATILETAGITIPDYFQGQSLWPVLTGEQSGDAIREFVRCEYFDALDPYFTGGSGAFGTMHRRGRWKLCVYHSHHTGELYDLEEDPWEHEDLWHSPEHQGIKAELIAESFDAHVNLTTDVGSRRIAPM